MNYMRFNFVRFGFIISFLTLFSQNLLAQLNEIKIIVPKEIGYSQGDFALFFDNEKYFATCGNAFSVFNTETCELIDEYDLMFGAKNMSISPDEKHFLVSVGNSLMIFTYENQHIQLLHKIMLSEIIQGIEGAEYYKETPIGAAFFINKGNEIYLSIANYAIIYDVVEKKIITHTSFPLGSYIYAATYNKKANNVIMCMLSDSKNFMYKQSLSNLSSTEKIFTKETTVYKMKLCDSLLMCFDVDKYYVLNIENGSVVHEITLPVSSAINGMDEKSKEIMTKRTPFGSPDKTNFFPDEYILDIDYLRTSKTLVFATSKEMKYYSTATKKTFKKVKGIYNSIRVSPGGTRMATNGYLFYKSLRMYNPNDQSIVAEKNTMGNPIYSTAISPNKKWLYTNGSHSGYIWNLNNFTKSAEIKDLSEKDSSFIMNVHFLNDSEIVVNSGTSINKLNLFIYNFIKKQVVKVIKKDVYSVAAGFNNGEFYYADYGNLYILNLKTNTEEKYQGMYSIAAVPTYNIITFTKDLVFVPSAGKFAVVNRKTKETVYESESWAVNTRVFFGEDGNSLFTSAQIKKKRTINGYEFDQPTNAIVKIDLKAKTVAKDYAATIFPYDMKLKENNTKIAMWYVKYDLENYNPNEYEVLYTEYNIETGEPTFNKSLDKTSALLPFHYTSENGKYIALSGYSNEYFKVFNDKGEELIDLKNLSISTPKCFIVEEKDLLIITSSFNSMATFVDLKNRKVIGQLANAEGDQFFLITSDLHYLGAKEFVKNIRFKYKNEIYGFEQFDAYLNQPHQVLRAFSCTDSALIKAYEKAYTKRLKLLGVNPEAKVNFSALPNFLKIKMAEGKPGLVNFSVSLNKGNAKLQKLKIINNGSIISNEEVPANQKDHFEKNYSFETSSGINRFEFVAVDESGLESPHITRFYNNTQQIKPDLYLAVIASEKFNDKEFDLAYAVKDATDMANTMSNSKAFNKVNIKKFFNKSFSNDSLPQLKNFFAGAGVNDVIMIFFAGHGFLDVDFSYYFPTYYTDFTDPKINSVSYTSFDKILKDVKPLRKLMFIDACFSGEVDQDEIYFDNGNNNNGSDTTRAIRATSAAFAQSTALEMSKTVFTDLRESSGATVISSAGGTEAALEGERWNNGLFTHCVLEGLVKLKADLNEDGKISLTELQKFVAEEVYKLSDGKQMPTYRIENTILDYELW